MERVTGVEPVSQPWEGRILPLYYTRIIKCEVSNYHQEIVIINASLRCSGQPNK